MKPIKYSLEIYPPMEFYTPVACFESASPFISFHKGDLISAAAWDSYGTKDKFEVIAIEHFVFDVGSITHKIMVYTKEVLFHPHNTFYDSIIAKADSGQDQ